MDILLAILRKVIFIALVFGAWRIFDVYYCKAFNTDEVLKDDAKAIALLLGLLAIAISLA